MTSSYTARRRILKQGAGDSINLWGDLQSSGDFDVIDYSMDGWASFDPTGNITLTTANGSTSTTLNQAGARALKMTTAVATATTTLPSAEGWWLVWNATTAAQTVASAGGGSTVSIAAGEIVFVLSDSMNIKRLTLSQMTTALDMGSHKITSLSDPTNAQDAATKNYADNLAFASFAGTFPAQGGNAGKFTKTDGAAVSWAYAVDTGAGLAVVVNDTVTVTAAAAGDVRTGTDTSKAVTSAAISGSAAFITLTDAATVPWDASAGYNAEVTLGGNRLIGAPTNLVDGQVYTLDLIQDATGTRIPTWNAIWDFGAAGTPVLQTAVGKRDKVVAQYRSSTSKLYASFRKGA